MADIQKPIDIPAETAEQSAAPTTAEPTVLTDAAISNVKPSTGDAAVPVADETKPEGDAAEEPSAESKPIEEGYLGYKAQGLSFPKNLLGSKEFFFFGSDAVEAKALEAYKKSHKSADGALENIAWAAHTGKGLLFSGDRTAPQNVINLAHATEPEVDGNRFHFATKGNKHTFKAANVAERDGWVAQIKSKIAEAKEIATSVTESEAYKTALENLKPAHKEETKATEASTINESTDAAKTDEPPKEDGEVVKEEPSKRRSASRKRASFFGFGKKDVLPKEESKNEGAAPVEIADESAVAGTTNANADDAPVEEISVPTEAIEEPVTETSKPVASKRNSFFGGVFSKKEKKTSEPSRAAETTEAANEAEAANESAPVIPPVEATSSLTDDVNAAEPTSTEAAATEIKTDVKEKRKSSLPFFSKRDASPVTGEEKAKGGAFSKFRATIKGKGATKVEEANEESSKAEETATKSADAQDKTKDTVADIKEQAAKAVEGEPETKAGEAAPAVTASA